MPVHDPYVELVASCPFPLDPSRYDTPVCWYKARTGKVAHLYLLCTSMRTPSPAHVLAPLLDPPAAPCQHCWLSHRNSPQGQYLADASALSMQLRIAASLVERAEVHAAEGSVTAALSWAATTIWVLHQARADVASFDGADDVDASLVARAEAIRVRFADVGLFALARWALLMDRDRVPHPEAVAMRDQLRATDLERKLRSRYMQGLSSSLTGDPRPAMIADLVSFGFAEPELFLDSWTAWIDNQTRGLLAAEDWTVVHGPHPTADRPTPSLTGALWWWFGHGQTGTVLALPSVASKLVRRRDLGATGTVLGPAEPGDTDEVYTSAAALIRTGSEPAAALDVARLVLSPIPV